MANLGNLQVGLFLVTVFAAVAMIVYAVAEMATPDRVFTRRRLRPSDSGAAVAALTPARQAGLFQRLLVDPLKGKLVSEADPEVNSLRMRLIQAGIQAPHAVAAYYVLRLLLGGGIPLLVGPFVSVFTQHLTLGQVVAANLVVAAVAYAIPGFLLARRLGDRQRQVREAFPDALDLMIICIEAGLGLDAALARVAQEIAGAHPLLGEHFARLVAELRAGKSRDEAWRSMSGRMGVAEVTSLVTLLMQTEALGSSVADALRAHAGELRTRRLLKAEEKAQQLAVKMTFPLILMILPALMIVVGTPAILHVYRTLPQIANHDA